ncbi:MAG: ABC-F family ATP-binding cassette domain-containing protein [Acholeplasmatales bacterium]|nr:ABC-F family ATP-binding cassette domain-containing protein [Acholeplasmatales bacterium]
MNITFDNVSFKYIERKILDNVSFSINDTDKVGVVGVNGTGKTTLIKLILGNEKPNSGEIIISGGMRINYLPQDPKFDESLSLINIIMKDSTKENPILEYEAESILKKMGFNDTTIKPINFSGGQLKRLALAKSLVTPCDLLILDEPTNHLDNSLIVWLEKYLIKFKKGLFMVTHDRYFLQRVCNKMLEIDFGKIYIYEANYDLFLELKAKRLKDEEASEKRLKRILSQEREWMTRGVEARRTKSKSRIERFKKLSEIKFYEHKEMEFNSLNTYLGKKLISMINGKKAYGDKLLFDNFTFDLERNDIIGVVGDNGCGKSTLFKILMGLEQLDSGQLILGETLKIGYFSQNLELIDPEIRVIDYIKEEHSLIETLDGTLTASDLLEQFLFNKDLQYTKVKMLSGGEKRRLQLVKVLINNPNILLFDEPTNDLDLYTLEILENYLMDFKGPILTVSHDRYFLDKICNKLFVYNDFKIDITLDSFSDYLTKKENEIKIKETKVVTPRNSNKMLPRDRNELNKLETLIPELENKLKELKDDIPNHQTDFHKLLEIQAEIDELENDIDVKTNRYLELLEIKESFN